MREDLTPNLPFKIDETRYFDDGRSIREIRGYRNQPHGERDSETRTITTEPEADGSSTTTHRFSDHPLEMKVRETTGLNNAKVTEITINDGSNNLYDFTITNSEVSVMHNRRSLDIGNLGAAVPEQFVVCVNEIIPEYDIQRYVTHLTKNMSLTPETIAESLQNWLNRAKPLENERPR